MAKYGNHVNSTEMCNSKELAIIRKYCGCLYKSVDLIMKQCD